MFTSCGTSIGRAPFGGGLTTAFGLGYQTSTTGVGTSIQSFYSTPVFHVLDFNITGNDPINTTQPVPSYTVSTVGAQPIVVSVAPAGGTGIGAATDINTFTLSQFYEGVLGRATDLVGPTTSDTITTLVREPLSGTYNTFEYSVPNNSQFKGSQDDFNCSGNVVNSNPMNLQSTAGSISAFRRRVIGTGEMVAQLQAATSTDQRLGYFFWSAANASKFTTTNGKYLTVNGVDPLQNAYSNGIFPGISGGPALSAVTFTNLNQGDYPIWSALRLVSTSPTPAGVTAVISGAQTLNSTQSDFIPLSKLTVWHSHFALPAINSGIQSNGPTVNPATPGDLCSTAGAVPENGGDAGGANVLKQNNSNFCSDFHNQNGIINRNN
jgi:ABC-type phosphate transport system substrate-binding protein